MLSPLSREDRRVPAQARFWLEWGGCCMTSFPTAPTARRTSAMRIVLTASATALPGMCNGSSDLRRTCIRHSSIVFGLLN